MKAIINGISYQVFVADNALGKSFAEMLPLDIVLSRSGEHQYYAALPSIPDIENAVAVSEVKRDSLYYFKAWNVLSLNFKDMNISPYEVHELGTVVHISEILEQSGNKITVRFEAAED